MLSKEASSIPQEAPSQDASPHPSLPRVLTIVPAFNEEERLSKVLHAIRRYKPGADILVVDDGSTDQTSTKALEAGAFVLQHPFNLGCGAALQTGYKYALEQGYEFTVQIDADGQHDPGSLDTVLKPVEARQADVVIGSRFLWEGGYTPPLERRIGSWLFGRIASLITGRRITDPTSGYRAMNRKALALCALGSFPHDYPDADVLITLHHNGLAIEEVPALMHPRKGGRSMHRGLRPVYYIFKMSLSIFVALLRERPKLSG